MSLRLALHTLEDRFDGQPAVWAIGLLFGLTLDVGFLAVFALDVPSGLVYVPFVLLVAPLFGAALWPYVRGAPPTSWRALRGVVKRRYTDLLAARAGYLAVCVLLAAAAVAAVGVLATLVSLANYLSGGGATTLAEDAAVGGAFLSVLVVTGVALAVGRVALGFLDAAALRDGPPEAFDRALAAARVAPGRATVAAVGLSVYRVGTPLVAYLVLAASAGGPPWEVLTRVPGALPVEVLAAFLAVNLLVTAAVWPVAWGYHLTLYETLRPDDSVPEQVREQL